MSYHKGLFPFLAAVLLCGCAGEQLREREKHYLPTQAAGFYLGNLLSGPMETSLYMTLSSATRKKVPFPAFVSSLSAFHSPGIEGSQGGRVTIVDRLDISDGRSIIYALFQWPQPREGFFLGRVDCRLEGDRWKIELPASGGSLRPVDVIFEGDELDEEAFAGVGKIVAAERAAVMKDLERKKMGDELRAAFDAREETLSDLIILGKGCYNGGRYRKAMTAFGKVLKLDPENALAREYMDKCKEALRKD